MNFILEYRNSLRAKKYTPLPQNEANKNVINKENLDQVANSLQRMVLRTVSKRFHFISTPDSTLMEAVQVCNLAIAEAMNDYTNDKLDFAVFAMFHMTNYLNDYLNRQSLVKSSVVKGERQYASYFYLDEPNEEEDTFDVPFYDKEGEDAQIDKQTLLNMIRIEKPKYKERHLDVFLAWAFKDESTTNRELAKNFNISPQKWLSTL